jgi:hypothetical protein
MAPTAGVRVAVEVGALVRVAVLANAAGSATYAVRDLKLQTRPLAAPVLVAAA